MVCNKHALSCGLTAAALSSGTLRSCRRPGSGDWLLAALVCTVIYVRKGLALLKGRDYVLPDDVRHLAPLVLGHRILMTPEAELEGAAGGNVPTGPADQAQAGVAFAGGLVQA